jgi:hypothetical protein
MRHGKVRGPDRVRAFGNGDPGTGIGDPSHAFNLGKRECRVLSRKLEDDFHPYPVCGQERKKNGWGIVTMNTGVLSKRPGKEGKG